VDRMVVRAGWGSGTGKPKLNSLHTGVFNHGSDPHCIYLIRTAGWASERYGIDWVGGDGQAVRRLVST
jgi:hypothetical protein